MADPKLTIVIEQKGADGVVKSLKEIEKVGNTTYTRVIKDGQVASETMKTVTGAAKVNYSAITALSTGYLALTAAIGPAVRFMTQAVKAAQEDEASIVRRNVAIRSATGYTEDLTAELEKQADVYSKVYGVSDDYTRELQTQFAAIGANAQSVEQLTTASLGLSKVMGTDSTTAAIRLTKFMEGTTNSIKGTTIAVDKDADAHERWQAVMEQSQVGLQMLNAEMETGKGAADRVKTAWGEMVESIGRLGNSPPAVEGLNSIADALNDLSDYLNTAGPEIVRKLGIIYRIGLAAATSGYSEAVRYVNQQNKPPVDTQAALDEYNRAKTNAGIAGLLAPDPTFDKTPGGGGGGRKKRAAKPQLYRPYVGGYNKPMDNLSATMLALLQDSFLGNMIPVDPSGISLGGGAAATAMLALGARTQRSGGTQPAPYPWAALAMSGAMHPGGYNSFFQYNDQASTRRGFPEWWKSHGSDYTQVAQGFIGGGAQGGLSALGSLAGNAVLPGLGGILGGLLGGGIGKLFGGHKKRQGETPAQPIYTSDMNLQRLVTDLLNVTKMSIVRGASGGIDAGVKMLNAQNARAGV